METTARSTTRPATVATKRVRTALAATEMMANEKHAVCEGCEQTAPRNSSVLLLQNARKRRVVSQERHRRRSGGRCIALKPCRGATCPGAEAMRRVSKCTLPETGGVDNVGRGRYSASQECRQRRQRRRGGKRGELNANRRGVRRCPSGLTPSGAEMAPTKMNEAGRGEISPQSSTARTCPRPRRSARGARRRRRRDVGNDGAMYPPRKGSDGRIGE